MLLVTRLCDSTDASSTADGAAKSSLAPLQFMEVAKPEEDFILVLDSDMLIHRPFLVSDFQLARGQAASGNM